MSPLQKLLIGTWKSDNRKTLQNCHRYHCLRGAKKRFFGGLFGKLELRYTRKYVHHKLRNFRYRARYDVIAEDAESMVIRIHSNELKKHLDKVLIEGLEVFFRPNLQQITFRSHGGRQYYWIGLATFCEWFQKKVNR